MKRLRILALAALTIMGSFVMVAEDFSAFGQAMVKKLIAEIAWAPRRRTVSAAR